MTGRIFIEADDVTSSGLPSPAKHLYLVYEAESGVEYTLRGGPDGNFGLFAASFEILDNVKLSNSPDRRDPSDRSDRNSTELDFAGMTDDQAWALMLKYARAFEATDPDYNILTYNSNTFIGALLAATGQEPDSLLPNGVSATDAIGFGNFDSILDDLAPPTDWRTLGTAAAETISGEAHGEEIVALGGNDVVLARGGSDLIFGGSGADRLHGQGASDALHGGRGADQLFGGNGDDVLEGGRGKDQLSGGNGADAFIFNSLNANHIDAVTDFVSVHDEVRLQDSVFEEIDPRANGFLKYVQFHVGEEAHDANDRIIYTRSTGQLWYDEDGDGSAASVLIGDLEAGQKLTANDLFVL